MLPTLDARLAAAAELVRPGEPVADIGCDHGKLTAVLAASGKYPKVIGADLRPGPLAKAEQTLEHAGCKDRAELRLGDGLSVLTENEVGSIVLAGVSAQTTWEMVVGAWLLLCSRPPGAGGGPLVRGDGGGIHRQGVCAHLCRVPVWQYGRVARGKRLRRLAEGKAAPDAPWRAGWQ